MRIGFLINPTAGMGGKVGLKGTDNVVDVAIRLGATPVANARAAEALEALKKLFDEEVEAPAVRWLTCSGGMGADALRAAGFTSVDVVHEAVPPTSAEDTRTAVAKFLAAGVQLVLFCGGDGTARDVCGAVGERTPILGIPSGVKMYSGVFGVTPARTAEIVLQFIKGEIGTASAEILDLDEEKYREGEWAVRLQASALTPFEQSRLQSAKALIVAEDDEAIKQELAAHLREQIAVEHDAMYLLGPGSTVAHVGRALGVDKTLLGIDAIAGGAVVGRDLNERQILDLLRRYPRCRLVLSPIGAQGFLLGRGNLPLSPAVIQCIGLDNIIVIATPAKLARTPVLRVDTGDAALDRQLISLKYMPVVIAYHRIRLVKIAA